MSITVSEAGQKGGATLLRRRGRAYFSEIGRKGQRTTRARYPNMARIWGQLGGRPRKPNLQEIMGEKHEKKS